MTWMVSHSDCPRNEDGPPKGSAGSSSPGTGGSGAGKQQPALKKGPWTAADDAILMEYVKKNGEGNWNAVQKNTSLARCGKSCRLRWTNHLRPNLKKGSFTPEEERLILQLHAQLGNKWARMAAQLPGRTDNEIKNYWNTRIKRRIRQGLPLYPHDVSQKKPPASPPAAVPSQRPEPQSSPGVPTATGFRHRPHIQIPTRNFSAALDQFQSPSPCSLSLSPHSYHHLKTTFDNSLSFFDSSTSLPHPASTFTTSPLLYKQYIDPNLNLNPFPLQSSVTSSQGSPLPSPVISTNHLPNVNSFQFNPLTFNMNSAQSLQTQYEQERLLSSCPVYGIGKPEQELPSNQLYLFQTEKHETETTAQPDVPQSNSGLLEDLLKEAETFTSPEDSRRHSLLNLQVEKFDFSLNSSCCWDATGSDNTYAGVRLKAEAKDQIESMTVHEDLSKLLNTIPSSSSSHMLEPYNSNLLENPSSQSPGYASGITDDSIGLEIQHIASLLHTDSTEEHSREPGSCSWNNLPRIC